MPPIDRHIKTSLDKTGKDYKEVHEWLDSDPDMKAERHDMTKIYEFGKIIEEKYGKEALQEYIRHIHDDVKAKFDHLKEDLDKALAETLEFFGVK
ncbi:hypothetical protein H8E50_12570 [bacterium]|nr:hypothetical protein [bacterium]